MILPADALMVGKAEVSSSDAVPPESCSVEVPDKMSRTDSVFDSWSAMLSRPDKPPGVLFNAAH